MGSRQLAAMRIDSEKTNRTSLALGWEAAKANAVPAFILQAAMLLILVVLVLAAAGVIRLAQTLEPKQRVVLFAVFLLAIAYAVVKLMQLGVLGRHTAG